MFVHAIAYSQQRERDCAVLIPRIINAHIAGAVLVPGLRVLMIISSADVVVFVKL